MKKQPKQKQDQNLAADMFPACDDLPLFSDTPQQVEDSLFAPQPAPQPELEQIPLLNPQKPLRRAERTSVVSYLCKSKSALWSFHIAYPSAVCPNRIGMRKKQV